uniref:Uncharacterized protein n=1 Tax=Chromera velia CCMP2878 TaxID=1169474 RepID=A0A0G4GWK0_9ALVE|eukprot:Cvel_23690.t1-p1 / transcript=Cvel_23690.t1 / gene=Cvel_23690 / organism=Chromera_velia_CCMP2878 / gene_product=hypothetical protein / transcript_product=hypothetical protein / location=Cvel_scaffold2471:8601-10991(-) / protein_length=99 / sequence_SO=supercontig / SO=protein_coding / is_pseudo=false
MLGLMAPYPGDGVGAEVGGAEDGEAEAVIRSLPNSISNSLSNSRRRSVRVVGSLEGTTLDGNIEGKNGEGMQAGVEKKAEMGGQGDENPSRLPEHHAVG